MSSLADTLGDGGLGDAGELADAGDVDAGDADAALPPPSVFVAKITGTHFPPVSVVAGTTVRWVNASTRSHTVTSGEGSAPEQNPGVVFDAPLAPGASFEHTFATPGSVPYFCRPHESFGMTGVVEVR